MGAENESERRIAQDGGVVHGVLEEYFRGKHVAVTGAAGFIGSALVKRLNELGAIVNHEYFVRGIVIHASKDITKLARAIQNWTPNPSLIVRLGSYAEMMPGESAYQVTKRLERKILLTYPNSLEIYLPSVYGRFQKPGMLIPNLLQAIDRIEPITVDLCKRGYLYIDDAVTEILIAIASEKDTYVGGEPHWTVEVVDMVQRFANARIDWTLGKRDHDAPNCSFIKTITSLEEGLKKTLNV